MPVGSNLPFVQIDRALIRSKLNLPPDAVVLGTFGGNHPSRLFNYLAAAGRRLKSLGQDVRILSIGPAGPAIKEAMADLPIVDLGTLRSDEVSKHLQAVDVYCSPFYDGVSTRRGSFFAGLQHGLATVTSRGYNSDPELLAHTGKAFIATAMGNLNEFVEAVVALATDHQRREQIAAAAKVCFGQNYSLPVLADRWRDYLSSAPRVLGVRTLPGSNP